MALNWIDRLAAIWLAILIGLPFLRGTSLSMNFTTLHDLGILVFIPWAILRGIWWAIIPRETR